MSAEPDPAALAVYIHWPFCASKCPYCDFNSHVARSIDHEQWAAAYLSEIDRLAVETAGRTITSVFFGGGTPSLMEPWVVAAILDRIAARWAVDAAVEISLEANPGSVEAGRFRDYRTAGVTRASVGVQALDDASLRRLGRLHSAAEALQALDIARDTFEATSFDLIYARQDQTPEAWRRELDQALSFAPDHLSLYQLTIEAGTAFGDRHARGTLRGLPDDEVAADLYDLTQDLAEAAGLAAYEVSNHARPGAECRHNLTYWRCGDWGGIGPGAHGRLTLGDRRWATTTPLAPAAWLEAVATQGSGEDPRTEVPPADALVEVLLSGLRLGEGIDRGRLAGMKGGAGALDRSLPLAEDGLVADDPDRLRVTPRGRLLLDSVLRELLA